MLVFVWMVLLLAGIGAEAQEEEKPQPQLELAEPQEETRPAFEVPEPTQRRTDQSRFIVAGIVYDKAQEGIDRQTSALPDLMAFFRQHTDIKVRVRAEERRLGDDRLHQAAMLFMSGNDAVFNISEYEKKNLGKYLRGGGFLFAEDIRITSSGRGRSGGGIAGTPFDRQFKALIADPAVLGVEGRRWQWIGNDHPLYSTYFDFPTGPPLARVQGGNVMQLEALELRGRVVSVFSDLCISRGWGDVEANSRERDMQFGANLIVFAMAQRAAGKPMIRGR